jgi:hypothetical protein
MESMSPKPSAADARGERRPLLLSFLVVLLGAWVAFTVMAFADHGVVGFMEAAVANSAVVQVLIDLGLSVLIALVFIHPDARRLGLPFWPYFIAAVLAGSIGLIAYLVHRTWRVGALRP